jgi:hypothetical protein
MFAKFQHGVLSLFSSKTQLSLMKTVSNETLFYIIIQVLTFVAPLYKHRPKRKEERQVNVLSKHLAIFFLFPSKKFLPISSKIQLLEISPQIQKEQRQKQLNVFFSDVFSLPEHFELFAIFSYFVHFAKFVCLYTAEIETGRAEKSSWDQANIQQNQNLVWRKRKIISQIIKDYFYLPFFLLIIL